MLRPSADTLEPRGNEVHGQPAGWLTNFSASREKLVADIEHPAHNDALARSHLFAGSARPGSTRGVGIIEHCTWAEVAHLMLAGRRDSERALSGVIRQIGRAHLADDISFRSGGAHPG